MRSIIQAKQECLVCRTTYNLHSHHCIGGTANRKQSEKYGLKVWLCVRHHNMSNEGVHFNRELDLKVKRLAQRKFEETHTREEFRAAFGKSYL